MDRAVCYDRLDGVARLHPRGSIRAEMNKILIISSVTLHCEARIRDGDLLVTVSCEGTASAMTRFSPVLSSAPLHFDAQLRSCIPVPQQRKPPNHTNRTLHHTASGTPPPQHFIVHSIIMAILKGPGEPKSYDGTSPTPPRTRMLLYTLTSNHKSNFSTHYLGSHSR